MKLSTYLKRVILSLWFYLSLQDKQQWACVNMSSNSFSKKSLIFNVEDFCASYGNNIFKK